MGVNEPDSSVLVTRIYRGTVCGLIPVTSTGMTGEAKVNGFDGWYDSIVLLVG